MLLLCVLLLCVLLHCHCPVLVCPHAECLNPQLLSARVREVEEEVASRRGELSQPYCEIILKHSSYRNQQQDK